MAFGFIRVPYFPRMAFWSIRKNHSFWRTVQHDNGRGHMDCMGLLFPHTYFIRFRSFTEGPGELPTKSIKMLGEGIVLASKKPAKPIQHSTNTDRTGTIQDTHLVREVKEHKNFRFSSYTDYVKHKAAAERLREGV
jgi:hypothetical protein